MLRIGWRGSKKSGKLHVRTRQRDRTERNDEEDEKMFGRMGKEASPQRATIIGSCGADDQTLLHSYFFFWGFSLLRLTVSIAFIPISLPCP